MTTLTTRRLTLRPFSVEDEPAYARIRSEPQVARYLAGGVEGAKQAAETAARLVPMFAALWSDPKGPGYGPWALIETDSDHLIGHLGLRRLDELGGETELLYALHPSSHGKGYATEGARAALEFGFEVLKLPRIIALAAPENAASLKVMENVEMTRLPGLTKAFGLQVVKTKIAEGDWRKGQR